MSMNAQGGGEKGRGNGGGGTMNRCVSRGNREPRDIL